ncbi:hypothetical protein [Nocardia huaxiensis]|uniref:hypothetical protein n=1 Tax=Nocardia huaxiensis TaxID=2755382 RepID=UPI001E43891A|nr:hypothetical protein [Nocardia huaxiensis]UFT00442.1 hypothetical protein LPY97_11720 [Nocardia huaxiensis]
MRSRRTSAVSLVTNSSWTALLGHPIDDRKLHLEIALRLAAVYGDALLDARSG